MQTVVEMGTDAYLFLKTSVETAYPKEACGVLLGKQEICVPDEIRQGKMTSGKEYKENLNEIWRRESTLEKTKKDEMNKVHESLGGVKEGIKRIWIEEIRTLENQAEEKRKQTYFEVNPLQLYCLERELENSGKELLGFYHSHPDCAAVLSGEDETYMIPGLIYLIVSVSDGHFEGIRGYQKPCADGAVWGVRISPVIKTI